MSKKTKTIIAALVLLVLVAAAVFAYGKLAPQGTAGSKTVTLTVIHGDGSQKVFTVKTDEEMLGAALINEKLIEGDVGQYGLYVTAVDGEIADDAQRQWWCFNDGDGNMLVTGVDMTPVTDGDSYEAVLSVY